MWNGVEWHGVFDSNFDLKVFFFCNVGNCDIDDANLGVFCVYLKLCISRESLLFEIVDN